MTHAVNGSTDGRRWWRHSITLLLIAALLAAALCGPAPVPVTRAQGLVQFEEGIDPDLWYQDHEIEHSWRPAYLHLATGDPYSTDHGVYQWPYDLDSIGWSMQSYQDYGGTPYFHHGMDMMKMYGTHVYNRSGGQVINIENYRPGWDLYWEVAVLDPDGYIWQYHHIDEPTIPQYIWDKWYEYLADPINGGFIDPDTWIGDIIEWPVWSFGKQFNHIHLNILGAGGVYCNGFEFHVPLPDTDGPEIQAVGLLQNGQVYAGNEIEGDYSLYVRSRDLILDDVYWLPPWEITFAMDCGPVHTTWRFDTLPGGADRYAYLDDFYVVPPTCGNYDCRDYYIDLGFIPDSQFQFPADGGAHTVHVMVRDYAGNSASQDFTYTVIAPPRGTPLWQDDLETDRGWIPNPLGSDTATAGFWERGDPEDTYSNGPKQVGTTTSGLNDLVTGRLAGANADSYDIDGGVTTIRSPDIVLPVTDSLTLSFRFYLAHGNNASAADYLRVNVVGLTTTTVFEELGAPENDNGAWAIQNVSLDAWAGQTIYLLFEAADEQGDSLVEAAIDDVVIVAYTNQPPVALPQSVSTEEDTPVDIVLVGYDLDCDPLTYSIDSGPSYGTLSGTPPNVTYTPEANYSGVDAFTFVVSDGMAFSAPALVSITVLPRNEMPVAYPQAVTTTEDTALEIVLTGYDPDDDPLTFAISEGPNHGMLGGTAPTLTYTPTLHYNGPDAFAFVVSDGLITSTPAVVGITVLPANGAPVAYPQAATTTEDTALEIVLTGHDPDGDSLAFSVVSGPSHGLLGGIPPTLTYTPTLDYNGPDAFAFVVSDGLVTSTPALVDIAVQAVNDAPVALAQAVTMTWGHARAITLTGWDTEGDELSYSVVAGPAHGTLGGTAPYLTYTPAPGYAGFDLFAFVVNDGELDSPPAVVSITIRAAIYLPVVVRP